MRCGGGAHPLTCTTDMSKTALLLALSALPLASCATIMNSDGFTAVDVESTPPGARFTANVPGVAGVTPAVVDLPNGKAVAFEFTLDGHEGATVLAKPRLSGWVVGNILFGGIIGIVVDAVNSDARVHRDVSVGLVPVEAAAEVADAAASDDDAAAAEAPGAPDADAPRP